MLGRQQIAGIPTAIHELIKNAHDAYAQRVEVDYFRRERLLVLRDDGLGMTEKDVKDNWLTLGTESRLGANDPEKEIWTGPKKLPRRVITGEKGIGRLAVAAIGPVTLLISRAIRKDGPQETISTIVHWGLFEQPGIDVSSIVVPMRRTGARLPSKKNLGEMIEEINTALNNLTGAINPADVEELNEDLNPLRSVDPERIDHYLNQDREAPLTLSNKGFGTWFIVAPTAEELNDDIDRLPETMGTRGTSNFKKVLLGFANTMDSEYSPVIETQFRDHRTDEIYPLIGPKEFFTADDFSEMDHLVEGEFDDRGQFKGSISFFGKKHKNFVLNWAEGRGRRTRCGSFRIRLAALQGRQSESRLDRVTHAVMTGRLNELGGLYIYKDGIRVLPYGTAENDFLGIELRRTLSARDWYFSHRRMIGFIALSYSKNPNLSEKAGREGFRQNLAYRDLKAVLEEFFKSVAVRFFRSSSEDGSEYQELKEQYERESKALERRSNRVRERQKQFRRKLELFREALDKDYYEQKTKRLLGIYQNRILAIENEGDASRSFELIRSINADIRTDISAMHGEILIHPPRGLSLTQQLERDWKAYRRIYPDLINRTIGRLEKEVTTRVAALAEIRIPEQQRRADALETLESQENQFVREVTAGQRETLRVAEMMQKALKEVFTRELLNFRNRSQETIQNYSNAIADEQKKIDESWNDTEHQLRGLRDSEMELVDAVRRQLNEFRETVVQRTTVEDEVSALELSVERLKEQLEFQTELAQIGMAVGILGHEFTHTITVFRETVHELKAWADGTEEMRPLYWRLRTAFESLEGYLQMLTPLGRRLTRRKIQISGSEIELYLRRIFGERMKQQNIRLIASSKFNEHIVKCKTASLLGAFVNILDNALYWVGQEHDQLGEITLDADKTGFLIGNNGPGISDLDVERIFEFGWTSKPGGAGMGLSLAMDGLNREGFRLELRECGLNRTPVFAIVTNDHLGNQ